MPARIEYQSGNSSFKVNGAASDLYTYSIHKAKKKETDREEAQYQILRAMDVTPLRRVRLGVGGALDTPEDPEQMKEESNTRPSGRKCPCLPSELDWPTPRGDERCLFSHSLGKSRIGEPRIKNKRTICAGKMWMLCQLQHAAAGRTPPAGPRRRRKRCASVRHSQYTHFSTPLQTVAVRATAARTALATFTRSPGGRRPLLRVSDSGFGLWIAIDWGHSLLVA